MTMEFIDLKTQQFLIKNEIDKRISQVLAHGQYIMGPEVKELEDRLSNFIGTKHCITVSSGTDALLVAMMALGIQPGDEIITTPFTFISTGEMIALLGASPVFVDIDPKTYNIDPSKIESAITEKTRAIMPVSIFGQCADFEQINLIAKKYSLPVIEDGAQSFGATHNGKHSCSLSTIGCTSFFPSKPLGCYGDGGACFTDNDQLADAMNEIRSHGQSRRYYHSRIGLNGRLDTLQAAILLAKLEIFSEEVNKRSEIAQTYSKILNTNCPEVITPSIKEGNLSVYAQYSIQVKNRDKLINFLKEKNIPTAVHYPLPLNKQPALNCEQIDLPIASSVANHIVSLPMHPYLTSTDQLNVTQAIIDCLI
jgi:UDP-2-acetamido-2-deoxy-ribo-hexuluronate aminotransferase